MKEVRVAEELAEMLQNYAGELEDLDEEETRETFHDDWIVDKVCDMNEILYKSGAEEGRAYESLVLAADHPIKLFETVEVERFMSGTKEKLKVMSIIEVKPAQNGKLLVEFLAAKVKE